MRVINRDSLQAIATSNSEHHSEESGIVEQVKPSMENSFRGWNWEVNDFYRGGSSRRNESISVCRSRSWGRFLVVEYLIPCSSGKAELNE